MRKQPGTITHPGLENISKSCLIHIQDQSSVVIWEHICWKSLEWRDNRKESETFTYFTKLLIISRKEVIRNCVLNSNLITILITSVVTNPVRMMTFPNSSKPWSHLDFMSDSKISLLKSSQLFFTLETFHSQELPMRNVLSIQTMFIWRHSVHFLVSMSVPVSEMVHSSSSQNRNERCNYYTGESGHCHERTRCAGQVHIWKDIFMDRWFN